MGTKAQTDGQTDKPISLSKTYKNTFPKVTSFAFVCYQRKIGPVHVVEVFGQYSDS